MKMTEDVVIPSIENFIFAGTVEIVQRVFGTSKVTFISTSDRFRVAKLRESIEKDLTTPQCFLHLTSMVVDSTNRGNVRAMARKGTYTATNKDETAVRNIKIIPAQFLVEMIYVTPDFNEGVKFGKRWLIASQTGGLNFTITYDSISVDIPIHQEASVNVPDKDTSADVINTYEYLTTMEIVGYISDEANVTMVPMVDVTKINYKISNQQGTQAQFDRSFEKKWDDPKIRVTEAEDETIVTIPD
jgi:hypothetical protein